MKLQAWIDGRFVDWDKATVPILSHSFSRGIAVFEVVQLVAAEAGPAFFMLDDHIDRFLNSARLMKLYLPLSRRELIEALIATAARNKIPAGVGKFYAYSPEIAFGMAPPNKKLSLAVFCGDYASFGIDRSKQSKPLTAGTTQWRKLDSQPASAEAKVTGFYASAYLAALETAGREWQEPIFVDADGFVREGATHNDFFIKNGALYTTPLKDILPGTTRAAVLALAEHIGLEVIEADIREDELVEFDEAFCTGSVSGIIPIESINGSPLGDALPGPVTGRIIAAMDQAYLGRIDRFRGWLTYA